MEAVAHALGPIHTGTKNEYRAALAFALESVTNLVLLHLRRPDGDGLSPLSECRTAYLTMAAVALLFGDREASSMRHAVDIGGDGDPPEPEARDALGRALLLALNGSLNVAGEPHDDGRLPASAQKESPGDLGLTQRQMDVLALMMKGLANKHICRKLDLAEPTVKTHVTAILRALQVTSRTGAVLAVTQRGWRL